MRPADQQQVVPVAGGIDDHIGCKDIDPFQARPARIEQECRARSVDQRPVVAGPGIDKTVRGAVDRDHVVMLRAEELAPNRVRQIGKDDVPVLEPKGLDALEPDLRASGQAHDQRGGIDDLDLEAAARTGQNSEIGAVAADDRVAARAGEKRVVAIAAVQQIVRRVPAHDIAVVSADGVFDDGLRPDDQVASAPHDVRDRPGGQVDMHAGCRARQIQAVMTAIVVERDRVAQPRPVAVTGRQECQQLAEDPADSRPDAVDRVSRTRRGVRPVERLHREDVCELGRRRNREIGGDVGVLVLGEVRHRARLPAVERMPGAGAEARGRIVVAGVTEPERMADLVDIGLEAVVVDRGAILGQPVRRDVDRGVGRGSPEADRLCPGAVLAVVEAQLGLGQNRLLAELQARDVAPELKRLDRQALAIEGQLPDIVGDDSVGVMRIVEPRLATVLPVSRVQVGRQRADIVALLDLPDAACPGLPGRPGGLGICEGASFREMRAELGADLAHGANLSQTTPGRRRSGSDAAVPARAMCLGRGAIASNPGEGKGAPSGLLWLGTLRSKTGTRVGLFGDRRACLLRLFASAGRAERGLYRSTDLKTACRSCPAPGILQACCACIRALNNSKSNGSGSPRVMPSSIAVCKVSIACVRS